MPIRQVPILPISVLVDDLPERPVRPETIHSRHSRRLVGGSIRKPLLPAVHYRQHGQPHGHEHGQIGDRVEPSHFLTLSARLHARLSRSYQGGPMRLTWLPDVISDAGLTVKVETGWTSRGYEFTEPISGIIIHHTATPASAPGDYPTLRIVRDGRSDLPGPLAQLGLGRSGTVYVIAAGRANHAGVGHWPGILGNADTIGIEAEHPGTTSHPWPTAQLAAYYRLCAALADY